MPSTAVKAERKKLAGYRFSVFDGGGQAGIYRFSVLDHESDVKTIAKFKFLDHAEMFLTMRREVYVKMGL